MIKYVLDGQKLTKEQLKEIEEASKSKIVFDEDCPELSPEMIKAFECAVIQRNKRIKRSKKVKNVKPLKNYFLLVTFENGTIKKYDVKPLFSIWEEFKTLAQVKGLFEQVKVDTGGYGIVWNNYLDLSCNELYENGENIS